MTEDTLSVDLVDGRTISVPLAWYPRLLHGTPEQRANWHGNSFWATAGGLLTNMSRYGPLRGGRL